VITSFNFRLEKVLRWRQAQLAAEQFALSRLAVECARWDTLLAKLQEDRAGAMALTVSSNVNGRDLKALSSYQNHIEQQRKAALDRLRVCREKMEEQRIRLLKARREHRLLEKLRQIRRAEWEAAVNREFDALAAETYLAQWAPRDRRNSSDSRRDRP